MLCSLKDATHVKLVISLCCAKQKCYKKELLEDSDEDSFFLLEVFSGAVMEQETTVIDEPGTDTD